MAPPFLRDRKLSAILPDIGSTIDFCKIRSGTQATPVVQMAERRFQLVVEVPAGAAVPVP
jgi:hypothetical protein